MKLDDKVNFYIDIELFSGTIINIETETVDVKTYKGIITNIPKDGVTVINDWDEIFDYQARTDGANYTLLKEWLKNNYKAPEKKIT